MLWEFVKETFFSRLSTLITIFLHLLIRILYQLILDCKFAHTQHLTLSPGSLNPMVSIFYTDKLSQTFSIEHYSLWFAIYAYFSKTLLLYKALKIAVAKHSISSLKPSWWGRELKEGWEGGRGTLPLGGTVVLYGIFWLWANMQCL